jgi:hypothetical protein
MIEIGNHLIKIGDPIRGCKFCRFLPGNGKSLFGIHSILLTDEYKVI